MVMNWKLVDTGREKGEKILVPANAPEGVGKVWRGRELFGMTRAHHGQFCTCVSCTNQPN
jgi:hypothetical protein